MKIIGTAGAKRFFVEVTEDELAQIDGHESAWLRHEYDRGARARKFVIGDEIPISPWWNIVKQMREKEAGLKTMGENLKALGKLVVGAWPEIVSAMQEEQK